MADTVSTNTLIAVVAGLKTPNPALLGRYFPRVETSDTEEIHFDVLSTKRRIAPFVSPLVEGKVVAGHGFTTNTFKPAYIKDKRVFDPSRPLKRSAGEQIGGSLTPEQRRQAYIASELQDQIDMITRRLEVMASEVIRTGKVTVVGDGYPQVVVDFGRTAALTPTALASTARWGQSAETPLENLQTWSDLVLKESGTAPVDVIMGVDAWTEFRQNADVKARLDTRRVTGNGMDFGAQLVEGLSFRGTIDGYNIWTYGGWYVDPADGVEKAIFPADQVAMTSELLEGVRAFGAIRDGKAGYRALPYFPKIWEQEDPAVEFLMMQSAPLLVPLRTNASLGIDVL
jgi:hypothetical protein